MKTILYATDYSKNSIAALKYAYSLSKVMQATLKVIHVFDYPTMLDHFSLKAEDPFPDIEGDAIKKHSLKLNAFCKEHLGANLDKTHVKVEAIEDKSVVHGITKKAHALDAFLIITGMKGVSAIKEIIMGSTTKQLLKSASCPVITIPEDASHTKIKTIVYATDFEEEDLGAIHKLVEIAEPLHATIKIVHVFPINKKLKIEEEKALQDEIHKSIKYANLVLDVLYSDDIFNTLKIYFSTCNADLIGMLERENQILSSHVFHRDLVKKMASYGKIPLVSFNAKNYSIFHL
ncbi:MULTISPECIES: universal stress protein [unclassified Lacinutrix]